MIMTTAMSPAGRTAMPCSPEPADEELLGRFLGGDETGSQEAFRALVVRHGPMVLGICRHVLGRRHDAEDAFQATFLALARKGRMIRDRRVLAGWLHEVAYRIALKARVGRSRRLDVERRRMALFPPPIDPGRQEGDAALDELGPVLHEEVDRLPDKYRLPVILSYLEGKSNEEVAELLRWPVGTVKGRLSRARDLLRSRLLRRGLALAAALLVRCIERGQALAEAVPSEWIDRTVRIGSGPLSPDSSAAGEMSRDFDSAEDPGGLSDLSEVAPPARRQGLRTGLSLVAVLLMAAWTPAVGGWIAAVLPGPSASPAPRISRASVTTSPANPSALPPSDRDCAGDHPEVIGRPVR